MTTRDEIIDHIIEKHFPHLTGSAPSGLPKELQFQAEHMKNVGVQKAKAFAEDLLASVPSREARLEAALRECELVIRGVLAATTYELAPYIREQLESAISSAEQATKGGI